MAIAGRAPPWCLQSVTGAILRRPQQGWLGLGAGAPAASCDAAPIPRCRFRAREVCRGAAAEERDIAEATFDACVIGPVARDINTIGGTAYEPRAGGAAYYATMVYTHLGLRAAVLTKVAAR